MTLTDLIRMRERDNGVEIALHVQPRAQRDEITGVYNGALKLRLTAPPIEGAANQAVIEFFSALLKFPKRNIRIIAGHSSRDKMVRIEAVSASQFLEKLGASTPFPNCFRVGSSSTKS